jgi:glycosyltransferase involved in cell wall biosynthesis
MRVLMLAPEEFMDFAGTPLSVYSRARTLAELGHRIDLVVYHVGRRIQLTGVRIVRIPALPFVKRVKVGPSLAKVPLDFLVMATAIGLLMRNKYDYIHAHEEAAAIAGLLGAAFGIPFLYDMHSCLSEQMFNYGVPGSRAFAAMIRCVEVWMVRRAAGVIVVYDRLATLSRAIAPRTKTTVIHNMIFGEEMGRLAGAEDCAGMAERIRSLGRRIVTHVGTLESNQGLSLLLDAAGAVRRECPDVTFVIVGGKPEQIVEHQAKVARLGMTDYFIFTGQVPPDEAWRIMQVSDVLLSLRDRGNNPPLKIYTYLAAGRPIVATNLPVHSDVLTDREAVLTEPTGDGVSKGIIRVLKDEAYAKELAGRATRLAREKYGHENFVRLTAHAVAQFDKRRGSCSGGRG